MEPTFNKYIGRKEEKKRGGGGKDEEREESPWTTGPFFRVILKHLVNRRIEGWDPVQPR